MSDPTFSRATGLAAKCDAEIKVRVMAKSDEAALHRRFASLRVRGEWFDPAVLALEAQE